MPGRRWDSFEDGTCEGVIFYYHSTLFCLDSVRFSEFRCFFSLKDNVNIAQNLEQCYEKKKPSSFIKCSISQTWSWKAKPWHSSHALLFYFASGNTYHTSGPIVRHGRGKNRNKMPTWSVNLHWAHWLQGSRDTLEVQKKLYCCSRFTEERCN